MKNFKSVSEMARHYNGTSKGNGALINDANVIGILNKEARRLERYLKEELQAYFDSYTPSPDSPYERTGNTAKSIRVSPPMKHGGFWTINVYFDPTLANHPSVMSGNHPDGYTPWLISEGWDIESKVGYSIPMFTKHPGSDYIHKAVRRFNARNPYGLVVRIIRNGTEIN